MKLLLSALALALPLTTTANTLYKCTDESGVVLYTNQKAPKKNCIVLSHQAAPPPAAGPAKPRASATPTPGDFPRVSGSEQKARDGDRRAILDKELANELQPKLPAAGATSLQRAQRVARTVAFGAMGQALHKVGAAVPLGGLRRVGRLHAGAEIQRTPKRQRCLRAEGPAQCRLAIRLGDGGLAHQPGVQGV